MRVLHASPSALCPPGPIVRRPTMSLRAHNFGAFECRSRVVGAPGMPAWIHDPSAVSRRIAAKRFDDVGPAVWQKVAQVAQLILRLPSADRPVTGGDLAVLRRASALLADAATRLSWYSIEGLAVKGAVGVLATDDLITPWRGSLDAPLARLCEALDDRDWVDPAAVAGLVADAREALEDYAAAAAADRARRRGRAGLYALHTEPDCPQ